MLEPSNDHERMLQGLSALSDGEADGRELRLSVDAWRQDPELRASWHCYALIGDVLRSDDLASAPKQDASFLTALRSKLAQEPVVLAPAVLVAQPAKPAVVAAAGGSGRVAAIGRARRGWTTTAAVAASFMVVAGVSLVWRAGPSSEAPVAAELAQADESASTPASLTESGNAMERSPDLDRYLAAHRQFAQGPSLAAPGGVRQVALTPEGR
ncbi:sigma-E factor negative regulatory protein [Ideonella azotifigens]|nr:sigma-E factor negative regulatory protein [Ideonella azotifigens]MCD2341613.1 sigma-E factor negative regulatory protein [Ideonella azotifigens]